MSFRGLGQLNIESGLAGALVAPTVADAFHAVPTSELLEAAPDPARGYLSGMEGVLLLHGDPPSLLPPVPYPAYPPVDVSLRSGLAGIALTRLAYIVKTDSCVDSDLLTIVALLSELALSSDTRIVSPGSSSASAVGLIDGWTGAALALDRAALVFGDPSLFAAATAALRKDIEVTEEARDNSLQVADTHRLLPYLAEGSAGILLGLLMVDERSRIGISDRTAERLARATEVRCSANGGLFMGRTGLLVARALAAKSGINCAEHPITSFVEELLPYCFTVDGMKGLLLGGQGGRRLSTDYCSGNAGVVRAIDCVANREGPWFLLPGLAPLGRLD